MSAAPPADVFTGNGPPFGQICSDPKTKDIFGISAQSCNNKSGLNFWLWAMQRGEARPAGRKVGRRSADMEDVDFSHFSLQIWGLRQKLQAKSVLGFFLANLLPKVLIFFREFPVSAALSRNLTFLQKQNKTPEVGSARAFCRLINFLPRQSPGRR